MSDNVGLSTPRGSGTSGYVQRNLAFQRPRDSASPYTRRADDLHQAHRPRAPDQGLLEHDRKREVEVKVFELRDKLEEEGYAPPLPAFLFPDGADSSSVDEDEIEARCAVLRKQLTASGAVGPKRNLKMHMVHELADAKMKESERLRVALKIGKDYEEGGHWRRQEERAGRQQQAGPGPVEEGGKARREWDAPPPQRRERGGRERSRSPPPAGRERDGERERRGGERDGERRAETTTRRERSYSRSVSRSRSRSRSPDERSRPMAEERRGGGRRERSYSRSRSRSRSMSRSRSRSRSVERRVSKERDRGGRRY